MEGSTMNKEKSVEIEGNTVEDAIKEALKIFGVSREALKVKVVCEEKKGLFGMAGAKLAKIKVTLKEEQKIQGISNE